MELRKKKAKNRTNKDVDKNNWEMNIEKKRGKEKKRYAAGVMDEWKS